MRSCSAVFALLLCKFCINAPNRLVVSRCDPLRIFICDYTSHTTRHAHGPEGAWPVGLFIFFFEKTKTAIKKPLSTIASERL